MIINNKPLRYLILILVLMFFAASQSFAQSAPDETVQTAFEGMMNAVATNNFAAFIAPGDDTFKTEFTLEIFKGLNDYLGSRLNEGYEAIYLTDLKLRGYSVYLWKLSFTDEGDDTLISISVSNGYVSGFFIQ